MRIITKILTTLGICAILITATVSLLIIQNPFSDNPPLIDIQRSQLDDSFDREKDDESEIDDEEDSFDIRFYGTWKRESDDYFYFDSFKVSAASYSFDRSNETPTVPADEESGSGGTEPQSEPIPIDYYSPPEDNISFIEGNFDINIGNQTIIFFLNANHYTYYYDFSNDNNTLTLTNIDTNKSYIYQRKIFNVNNLTELNNYTYQTVNITGILSQIDESYWYNLTLIDQNIVPVNASNVNYNLSNLEGKNVSLIANIFPYDTNYSKQIKYYNQICLCYLTNVDSDLIISIDE